ncbi:MAG: TolC family protein [Acidobacteriota bacterium]|nr:TolC family protein [Acidobacteriota bacterium]
MPAALRTCQAGFQLCGAVVLLVLGWPVSLLAADAPTPSPPAMAPGSDAPAALPAKGMGLLEVVRETLARDPNIGLVEAQVLSFQGGLLIAQGRFDPILRSQLTETDTRTPSPSGSAFDSKTLAGVVALGQQLESGLLLTPELDLLRSAGAAAPNGVAQSTATLTFTLRQPLLRGRGREVTTAGLRAAGRQLDASRSDLAQTVAQRIETTVGQYWNLVATRRNLDILRASEDSSRELLATTRKLIEADVTPAAEIIQVEANLAAKESARIGGERSLFKARQDLGREIGLDADEIAALPPPTDPFPRLAPEQLPPAAERTRFISLALAHRSDLAAARLRLAASDLLLRAAADAIRPELDLVLAPGYSGLGPGTGIGNFFAPLYSNVPGASFSVGMSLLLPLTNAQARGSLLEARADVPSALDAVVQSARQLDRAADSVRLFERAVGNEEKKLRAGTSTLIDLITQRDRLTAARQDLVAAELSLSLALLQLRFATGTLFDAGADRGALDYRRLTTPPDLPGSAP